jgi:ABC-type Fe3+/spermidine/putrescine transport system ATPase subunit
VRDFLGKTFLLPGNVTAVSDQHVEIDIQGIPGSALKLKRGNVISSIDGFPTVGQAALVAIRPEKISLTDRMCDSQSNVVEGALETVQFLGDRYEYTVRLGAESHVIISPEARQLKPGSRVFLELKSDGTTLWPRVG